MNKMTCFVKKNDLTRYLIALAIHCETQSHKYKKTLSALYHAVKDEGKQKVNETQIHINIVEILHKCENAPLVFQTLHEHYRQNFVLKHLVISMVLN